MHWALPIWNRQALRTWIDFCGGRLRFADALCRDRRLAEPNHHWLCLPRRLPAAGFVFCPPPLVEKRTGFRRRNYFGGVQSHHLYQRHWPTIWPVDSSCKWRSSSPSEFICCCLHLRNCGGGAMPISWMLGAVVRQRICFAAVLNWTVSARSYLPLVPAAAILIVRGVDAEKFQTRKNKDYFSGRWRFPPRSACLSPQLIFRSPIPDGRQRVSSRQNTLVHK